jgi:hypothetical protein
MDSEQTQQSEDLTAVLQNINPDLAPSTIPTDSRATAENAPDPYVENDKRRHDSLKGVFHWVVVWGIKIAFVIFLIVFLIRVSQLVLPSCWRWLSEEDIQGIDKLFFSGTIGGVIGRYMKVVIPDK